MSNNKNMNKNMNISDCPRDQLQYFIDVSIQLYQTYSLFVILFILFLFKIKKFLLINA